ncbi:MULTISPECIES: nuclear transport factor 2 family protein [unclassified Microbispora]|uniref:nuclear transport factor 2 family protein n=1 Tax=unclassified Microbispora TaxID=2614687 RepID=UPI0015FEEB1E|nr:MULTISPECIES: nuclear transport factor 2 family protein [unclassified Microbispora]
MLHVVERYFSAYNAHDLGEVMACYGREPKAVGPGGPAEGRSEVASYHTLVWQAFPDVRVTVWQKIVTDAAVAAAAVGTGTHAGPFPLTTGEVVEATGRRVSVRSCWMFDIDVVCGLIGCSEVFYDQLELCVQLGLRMPA